MNNEVRGYPEIDFVSVETENLVNLLIKSYEKFAGRTLYPADPIRLFILWIADIIIQERVNIDFSAKQNLPRYAEGKYLDSIAELFNNAFRLESEKAETVLKFTISTELPNIVKIPVGTRAAVDGKIVFETVKELIIEPGNLTCEGTARCQTTGSMGNGFIPGQINKIVDLFPYFKSVENITQSGGGAEQEDDKAFYERMRESMETYSTAGPMGGYEYYAKTASALISDVKAGSPTAGNVDVRVLLQGGNLPGNEILEKVTAVLTSDKVRPLTDNVTVSAPGTSGYDIDFTYYMQDGGTNGEENIVMRVAAAVAEYEAWQSEKMGRDINPSYLLSTLMQTGIKRAEIRNPEFTVVEAINVAKRGTVNIVNGGFENER